MMMMMRRSFSKLIAVTTYVQTSKEHGEKNSSEP